MADEQHPVINVADARELPRILDLVDERRKR